MRNLHLKVLSLVLVLTGTGTFLYKHLVLSFPISPKEETDLWNVEARISFQAGGGPVKATFFIPSRTPNFEVLDENFASYGYGMSVSEEEGKRKAVWAVRRAKGKQTLYYQALVYRAGQTANGGEPEPPPPFPLIPDYKEPYRSAALAVLDFVRAHSADVATFTAALLLRLSDPSPEENVKILLGGDPSRENKVRTAIRVLAGARIPARCVNGMQLDESSTNIKILPWLEVHNGNTWIPFNPETAKPGFPDNFFLWWEGSGTPLELENAYRPKVEFSVARSLQPLVEVAARRAKQSRSRLIQFSLFNLPVQTQNVFRILLLVPFGVLVVVIMRNVIGIGTLGTFMPVLIALAFRETRLVWGIVLFSVIVALGLGIRFYLERLKLLVVPRVAAVVVVVVLLMAILTIVSHNLGIQRGLSVALFPMIILSWTIERMSVLWEEEGPVEVAKQGAGSLFVASIGYLCMTNPFAQHLAFAFPEVLLIVLAVILLLGRYTGYRISELLRFRDFSKEVPK